MKMSSVAASLRKLLLCSVLVFAVDPAAHAQGHPGECTTVVDGLRVAPWSASVAEANSEWFIGAPLESLSPTPVPEPDVVWLGSLGVALLALRFRLADEAKPDAGRKASSSRR